MSSRIAETLLSGHQPARGTDAPARPGEPREAFGPVLDHALSGSRRTPPARRAERDAPSDGASAVRGEPRDDETDDLEDAAAIEDVAVEDVVAAAAAGDVPKQPEPDAVEITAEALAAELAVAEAPAASDPSPPADHAAPQKTKASPLREYHDAPPADQTPSTETAGAEQTEGAARNVPAELAPAAEVAPREDAAATEPAAESSLPAGDATGDAARLTKTQEPSDDAAAPADSEFAAEASEPSTTETRDPRRRDEPVATVAEAPAAAPPLDEVPPDRSAGIEPSAESASGPVDAVEPSAAASGEGPAENRGSRDAVRPSVDRALHGAAPRGADQGDAGRARFVGRVEGAIRAAHARDGRIQVRLSPPELGALRIELNMHNGVMTAHVEAETPAARNLLLDNLPALRDRLAQQDVRVDRFDVDVRRDGGGAAHEQTQDRSSAQGDERRFADRRAPQVARPTAQALPAAGGAPRGSSSAALDVRV